MGFDFAVLLKASPLHPRALRVRVRVGVWGWVCVCVYMYNTIDFPRGQQQFTVLDLEIVSNLKATFNDMTNYLTADKLWEACTHK